MLTAHVRAHRKFPWTVYRNENAKVFLSLLTLDDLKFLFDNFYFNFYLEVNGFKAHGRTLSKGSDIRIYCNDPGIVRELLDSYDGSSNATDE